jgi:hypothetical protein
MNNDYDFSDDLGFNKTGDVTPQAVAERPLIKNLPKSDSNPNSLRNMMSVPLAGGNIAPARVGNAPGVSWTKNFSKGGKVSSASKRADGIAQRGKTKGRYL